MAGEPTSFSKHNPEPSWPLTCSIAGIALQSEGSSRSSWLPHLPSGRGATGAWARRPYKTGICPCFTQFAQRAFWKPGFPGGIFVPPGSFNKLLPCCQGDCCGLQGRLPVPLCETLWLCFGFAELESFSRAN